MFQKAIIFLNLMRYVHSDAHWFEFHPRTFLKQPKFKFVCLSPKRVFFFFFFFRSYLNAVNGKSENR